MSSRELIILLLGLVIVAVILRGLYVAIQARKGQIKLAIDKNIPQDINLDALEFAELPGGGARVIQRDTGTASNDKLDPVGQANARAESMKLDRNAEAIPVLMDSVTLNQSELDLGEESELTANDYEDDVESENYTKASALDAGDEYQQSFEGRERSLEEDLDRNSEEELVNAYSEHQPPVGMESVTPDYDEVLPNSEFDDPTTDIDDFAADVEEGYSAEAEVQGEYEESNGILLDYEAEESHDLKSVQPDYPDDVLAEIDYEEDQDPDQGPDVDEGSDSSRSEPGFDPILSGDFDDFSMTAGERIGYQTAAAAEQTVQGPSSGFDCAEPAIPVKRTSLFTILSNKISQTIAARSSEEDVDESSELSEAEVDAFENDYAGSAESVDDEYSGQEDQYEDGEYHQGVESDTCDTEFDSDPSDPVPVQQDFVQKESKSEYEAPVSAATDIKQHQATSQPAEVRQQATSGQPSELLVLNVMAQEGLSFQGDALLHAVITQGLQFGEMNIFHYRFKNYPKGPIIFSLANILNPGTFDLSSMSDFSTIGVSLFLALPVAHSNYEAFEQMLDIAQQLCALLDGELKDDHRNVMTAQTIEHYRQRVRDFELRQLKVASARS